MDKIKAEMDSSQNPWIKKIGNYLLSRNDLEDKLNNQNKSLKECFDYILIEISKQSVKEGVTGYAAGEDDEIYSLAVHYFDEDNLEIGKKNFTTNADGSVELSRLMPKKQDVKEHAKDIDAIVNQKVKAELEKIREEEKVKKQKREELKKAAKKHKEKVTDIFEVKRQLSGCSYQLTRRLYASMGGGIKCWTYDKRYASGETSIFLIRKRDDVNSPFYTLELSSKNEIKQLRGKNNCNAVNEVLDFVEGWRRKFNLKSSILKQNEDA